MVCRYLLPNGWKSSSNGYNCQICQHYYHPRVFGCTCNYSHWKYLRWIFEIFRSEEIGWVASFDRAWLQIRRVDWVRLIRLVGFRSRHGWWWWLRRNGYGLTTPAKWIQIESQLSAKKFTVLTENLKNVSGVFQAWCILWF